MLHCFVSEIHAHLSTLFSAKSESTFDILKYQNMIFFDTNVTLQIILQDLFFLKGVCYNSGSNIYCPVFMFNVLETTLKAS